MRRLLWPAGLLVGLVAFTALLGPPAKAQGTRGLPVSCVVPASTATSSTLVGGDCNAKPGLTFWLTDVTSSTNAAGIAANSYNTLLSGTGAACGTGTATVWSAMTPAATQSTVTQTFQTPVRLPVNVDLCWVNTTAGSKSWVITGFYTP